MKKLYIITIAAVLLQLTLTEKLRAQISVGLRSGVNLAQYAFHTDETSGRAKPKTGVNAALLISLPINSLLSIQVEPGFSQFGTKLIDDHTSTTVEDTYRYIEKVDIKNSYVELPLMLQLNPKLGKFQAIINLGSEVRYRIGKMKGISTYESIKNGEIVESDESVADDEADEEFTKFDFGLAGGIGVALPVKSFKLFAEARYHLGLTNLVKLEDNGEFEGTIQNRAVSLNVGVLYQFGKGSRK